MSQQKLTSTMDHGNGNNRRRQFLSVSCIRLHTYFGIVAYILTIHLHIHSGVATAYNNNTSFQMSAAPPPSKRTSFQTLPDDDSASGIDESERSGPESGRWYTPTDHEEDNAPPKIRAERLRSLRQFRKYTIGYCK